MHGCIEVTCTMIDIRLTYIPEASPLIFTSTAAAVTMKFSFKLPFNMFATGKVKFLHHLVSNYLLLLYTIATMVIHSGTAFDFPVSIYL